MDNSETTIEYAHKAYTNTQETIRFIDTKSQVVIGLVTATFAGIAALALGALPDDPHIIGEKLTEIGFFWRLVFLLPWLAWGMCGVCSLIFSCRSLVARPPGVAAPTVLFPFICPTSRDSAAMHAVLDRLSTGLKDEAIVAEYRIQLQRVGEIVGSKIFWHRQSVITSIAQIVAAVFATLSFVVIRFI